MSKYKNLGLLIVILVIGYNAYDYFKTKNNVNNDGIEKCSENFRITNPDINKEVADKYCECILEKLGKKYRNSNIGAEKILEMENSVMQDCFDKTE
jgi:hypothetical protein